MNQQVRFSLRGVLIACHISCSGQDPRALTTPAVTDPYASRASVVRELRLAGRMDATSHGYQGVVTISNAASRAVEFGVVQFQCAVTLKLHTARGELVWDQNRNSLPRPGGCKWLPSELMLLPRASATVATEVAPSSLLRASLQPGAYTVNIGVIFARMVPHREIRGALTTQIDTVVHVPAGTLQLQ